MEECEQSNSRFASFRIVPSVSVVTFSEVKRPQKLAFWTLLYSKFKTEDCDQSNLCFSEDFRTLITCSTTYFLGMSAHVSLKIATNGYARGIKPQKISFSMLLYSKVKKEDCDQRS